MHNISTKKYIHSSERVKKKIPAARRFPTPTTFLMVRTLKELELLINEELAHVEEWLMLNKLTLNVKNQISLFSNLTKGS